MALGAHRTADHSALAVIDGPAGVGKTALAVSFAHQVADRFPGGQLYIDLHGFAPAGAPVKPHDALAALLGALGVSPADLPPGTEALSALYRSVLADRRLIVVLDNAHDAQHVRPLLPGGAACFTVVTSRRSLTGLIAGESAKPITLASLPPAESGELLVRRIGAARSASEPEAIEDLVTLCAGLPLTLNIAAAAATVRPDVALATIVQNLRDTTSRISAFNTEDVGTELRGVLSWSYCDLPVDAARVFRLLGLHPDTDIPAAAAAALSALPTDETERIMKDLVQLHLVIKAGERYALHSLVRAYAVELLADDPERSNALRRMLDHYLHTSHGATRRLDPGRDPIALPAPVSGAEPAAFDDDAAALAWFEQEHDTLPGVVDQAIAYGHDRRAWQIAWSITDGLRRRGRWTTLVDVLRQAASAAERTGDVDAEARMHSLLGYTLIQTAHRDEALARFERALHAFERIHRPVDVAHVELGIAHLLLDQGRLTEALRHAQSAISAYRKSRHDHGLARALNTIGFIHAQLGESEQALSMCRQALDIYRQLDARNGQADTLDSLGLAYRQLGRIDESVASYRQALALFRELDLPFHYSDTLTNLGDTFVAGHDSAAARQVWLEALEILEELGNPTTDRLRDRLRTVE